MAAIRRRRVATVQDLADLRESPNFDATPSARRAVSFLVLLAPFRGKFRL